MSKAKRVWWKGEGARGRPILIEGEDGGPFSWSIHRYIEEFNHAGEFYGLAHTFEKAKAAALKAARKLEGGK